MTTDFNNSIEYNVRNFFLNQRFHLDFIKKSNIRPYKHLYSNLVPYIILFFVVSCNLAFM